MIKDNMLKNKRVYLDFASQTLPSKKVCREMKRVRKINYNPANIYFEGARANKALESARAQIARTLGVKVHEVYFTRTGTMSCAATILGLVRKYQEKNLDKAKPHIITSTIEHPAVRENIKALERTSEIEATYISCDEEGIIPVEEIKKAIQPNTILISIMYVNNELGTIQDIKNISKSIKAWKSNAGRDLTEYPFFHTDACQAGNYLPLYVDKLGVDLLSFNGSKIYGPKSSAILMKKEYVPISSAYFGGGQERGLFSGTVDVERAVGMATAFSEAQQNLTNPEVLEVIARKRSYLAEEILKNIPEAQINGHFNKLEWQKEKLGIKRESREAKRIPSNLNIYLPGFPSDEMVLRLDAQGFSVSAGSACSARENEYSETIFSLYKNKVDENKAKKIAQESIRITLDYSTKKTDLEKFAKTLQTIYFQFKK